MNDQHDPLAQLLQYHSDLKPQGFTEQVVEKAKPLAKIRRWVLTGFTLLGLILSLTLGALLLPLEQLIGQLSHQPVAITSLVIMLVMSGCFWLLGQEG